ncbi:hypothetical protein BDF22DRAFT_656129 [Syncephalis plumigaleata]|nr:hypothetical protein BDF22DRAFT_656129 [Syncephalis plumigaleata]
MYLMIYSILAVRSLASYDDWYRKQGGAPIVNTVYMLRTKIDDDGVAGGPRSVPYTCLNGSFSSSKTTYTPVTLLPEAYHEEINQWVLSTAIPSIVTVVQGGLLHFLFIEWIELRSCLAF